MKSYLDCWIHTASELFAHTLIESAKLQVSAMHSFPEDPFGVTLSLTGEAQGRLTVFVDADIFESSLLGEGIDQKTAWIGLLKEIAESAARRLSAITGKICEISNLYEAKTTEKLTHHFQLITDNSTRMLSLCYEADEDSYVAAAADFANSAPKVFSDQALELLLDVELEVTLRFGSCELLLGEILNLGPGDVVQLDRHIHDPVDLLVGDKIVASGEVVIINGNFGLRVTEIAEPQRRLESVRCLF